MKGGWEKG